jgi:ABC-type Fe3+-hydroxamate transport system substrate-binding protein
VALFVGTRLRIAVCLALTCACAREQGETPRRSDVHRRIVSLNPTTTELLFALGAAPRLVGRSRWDVFPPEAREIPDVGDALRPNVERVLSLQPDLVVMYESPENVAAVERLRSAGINVLVLRIDLLSHLRAAIDTLGILLGDTANARLVRDTVFASLERVRSATAGLERPSVFWHVWDSPIITIGSGSFLTELVDIAGGRNIYADIAAPSATVSMEDIVRRNPDYILAGSVTAAHINADPQWRALPAVRAGRLAVFDTLIVGRPSVRVGEAALSVARLLHPGRIP